MRGTFRSTDSMFRAMQQVRTAQRDARVTHEIFGFNVRGKTYKTPTTQHTSLAEAEQKLADLERMNPGRKFVIVAR